VQTANCGLRYTLEILAHPPAIISCFVQIFSSAPCTQTPSIFVLLLPHSAIRDRLAVWPNRTFSCHNSITGYQVTTHRRLHAVCALTTTSRMLQSDTVPFSNPSCNSSHSVHSTLQYGVQTKKPVSVVRPTKFSKRPRQMHTSTDIRHIGSYLYGESDGRWISSWLLKLMLGFSKAVIYKTGFPAHDIKAYRRRGTTALLILKLGPSWSPLSRKLGGPQESPWSFWGRESVIYIMSNDMGRRPWLMSRWGFKKNRNQGTREQL
jgi:hypothetical protein